MSENADLWDLFCYCSSKDKRRGEERAVTSLLAYLPILIPCQSDLVRNMGTSHCGESVREDYALTRLGFQFSCHVLRFSVFSVFSYENIQTSDKRQTEDQKKLGDEKRQGSPENIVYPLHKENICLPAPFQKRQTASPKSSSPKPSLAPPNSTPTSPLQERQPVHSTASQCRSRTNFALKGRRRQLASWVYWGRRRRGSRRVKLSGS